MTPKEFKIWFDGFWAATDGAGVTIDALEQLKRKVDSIEDGPTNMGQGPYDSLKKAFETQLPKSPLPYQPFVPPIYVQPCKENNWGAVPLSDNPLLNPKLRPHCTPTGEWSSIKAGDK